MVPWLGRRVVALRLCLARGSSSVVALDPLLPSSSVQASLPLPHQSLELVALRVFGNLYATPHGAQLSRPLRVAPPIYSRSLQRAQRRAYCRLCYPVPIDRETTVPPEQTTMLPRRREACAELERFSIG